MTSNGDSISVVALPLEMLSTPISLPSTTAEPWPATVMADKVMSGIMSLVALDKRRWLGSSDSS